LPILFFAIKGSSAEEAPLDFFKGFILANELLDVEASQRDKPCHASMPATTAPA
jgi:hypothetical protein